jgi:hypothetical protein
VSPKSKCSLIRLKGLSEYIHFWFHHPLLITARIEALQKNEYAAMRFYASDDDVIAVTKVEATSDASTTRSTTLEVEVLLEGSKRPVMVLLDTGCTNTVVHKSVVTKTMSVTDGSSTYRKADGS